MSKEIKTRHVTKDIKVFDRAADVSMHMKNSVVKSKAAAENTQDMGYNSPSEYASDTISNRGKDLAQDTAHGVKNKLKNPHKKVQENVNKAKDHFKDAKQNLPKQRKQAAEQAQKTADKARQTADSLKNKADHAKKTAEQAKKTVTDAKRTLQQTRQAGRQTVKTAKQSAKSVKHAEKTIRTSAKTIKSTGKSSVKAAQKSVKTAEKTAKTAVKTAQQTAKAAAKSAQAAAKAAKAAAHAAKVATKAAIAATKAAIRITIALIKAAIAAIKGLVALIAAGGWVAVVIILIICLIALVVGSIFGIFFSGEDSGEPGGRTMPAVVSELTTEFYGKIEEIKNNNPHDVADVGAMSIRWDEVLAVYAVKVNTDPKNGMDVVTIDDGKVEKLRGVLNDMVTLSYSVKTETQERTVTTTDADGKEIETTETVTIKILVITMEQKSPEDMAVKYGFNAEQKSNMYELLDPQYADLWAALLGGSSAGKGEIGTPDGSRIPKGIFSWPMGEGFSITSNFGYRKDPLTGECSEPRKTDIDESTPVVGK